MPITKYAEGTDKLVREILRDNGTSDVFQELTELVIQAGEYQVESLKRGSSFWEFFRGRNDVVSMICSFALLQGLESMADRAQCREAKQHAQPQRGEYDAQP